MRNKKRFFISILVFLLISYLLIFALKRNKDNIFIHDDITFFKTFYFSNIQKDIKNEKERDSYINNYYNNNKIQYKFKVSYKNIDFKNINLQDTIKKETLVNGKIAPRN